MGLFHRKNKSVYQQIQDKDIMESTKLRDVYNTQQVGRSQIGTNQQTMTTRVIIAMVFGFIVFFIAWAMISGAQTLMDTELMHRARKSSSEAISTVSDAVSQLPTTDKQGRSIDEQGYVVDSNGRRIQDANGNPVKGEFDDPTLFEGAINSVPDVPSETGNITSGYTYVRRDMSFAEYEQLFKEYFVITEEISPDGMGYKDMYGNFFTRSEYSTMLQNWYESVRIGKRYIHMDGRQYAVNFDEGSVYAYGEDQYVYYQEEITDQVAGSETTQGAGGIGGVVGSASTEGSESGEYLDTKGETGSVETTEQEQTLTEEVKEYGRGYLYWLFRLTLKKFLFSLFVGLIAFGLLMMVLYRNYVVQIAEDDTADINQYMNDIQIQTPEEVITNFNLFPNAGCTSDVTVTSMISHIHLSKKGLKLVEVSEFADSDIFDENGELVAYKGDVLRDENDKIITDLKPIIDMKFGHALFEASGMPDDKRIRKFFDATQLPYNPGGTNRDKLKYETVADLVNGDWELPWYEPQRPSGAYIVDVAPVNTMVLAITRAGKGQTIIEPTIDMWLRERNPNNAVINDPKGELLVKHYVRATLRGFEVVQFNLINAMKTDIYNPLALAAESARDGDFTRCAQYVENIAEVFFPVDGGDDPVWPNAANNAFKRAAYGLIDYYIEEEKELRLFAEESGMSDQVLETKIDQMWGKVTLYNAYQMFVQLSAKKLKNPAIAFNEAMKNGEYDDLPQEEYEEKLNQINLQSEMWEDKKESDLLSLYFSATDMLPKNSMRNLVSNANNALKSMGAAEKMLASVYGIAITAMSFFTDPTISTLTSGTLSQNADLQGMSFPRRFGVRFNSDFLKKYHLIGLQAKWTAYEDPQFEKPYGKDFNHSDMITREGWARYYFKGIFPKQKAWIKLEIMNSQTGMLVRTFYFEFEKAYQTSLDGRYYMTDPILGTKIIKNGYLRELLKYEKKNAKGEFVYKKGHSVFKQMKVVSLEEGAAKKETKVHSIIRTSVRYTEKPKVVFLVTPPHLMKYAKLILILVKQLVDLNFELSYMTKANQKPLYKTRFMLDELGNLQSEGHGISGFQTMLSIGLGQEQQFTLILQTLQQLRDVYGDSVDKIVQGNAQPLDSLVAMKSGYKRMRDIQVSDEVWTPKGELHKVTGVFPRGVRKVYSVRLKGHREVKACNEHLWKVYLSEEDAKRWAILSKRWHQG